jgi:hypothetical protein
MESTSGGRSRLRRPALPLILLAAGFGISCSAAPPSARDAAPGVSGVSASWLYPVENDPRKAAATGASAAGAEPLAFRIAGNEYEIAAAVLRNHGRRAAYLSSIDLSALPVGLTAKAYLLQDYEAKRKSRWFDPGTVRGSWPDPCVPIPLAAADGGFSWSGGEPLRIGPGETLRVLIEWYSPRGNAGRFSGEAAVGFRFSDGAGALLPYRVSGAGFALPWEPSYRTAVGIDYATVINRHRALGDRPPEARELWLDYLRELGEHRLFPYNADPRRFVVSWEGRVDWRAFDEIQGPLLDGTLFPTVPPATSVRLRGPQRYPWNEGLREAYLAEIRSRFAERGWSDRLYFYPVDEPLIGDYPELREDSRTYRADVPGLRVLATEPYSPLLEPEVSIWCPDIVSLGDSLPFLPLFAKGLELQADFHLSPPPSVYAVERARGKSLWIYTCTSAQFLDYPNLFIDSPAAYRRVIPWLMQRYGAEGFLYYNAAVAYRKGNPWIDQYDYAANGDGTLFYPGVAGTPFVEGHRAVASLRMKQLRDGLEDYEYLELLKKRPGGVRLAAGIAAGVARSSLNFEKDIGALQRARERIIDELSR